MLRHNSGKSLGGDFDVVTGPPAPMRRAAPAAAEPVAVGAPAILSPAPAPKSRPTAAGRPETGRLEKPAA